MKMKLLFLLFICGVLSLQVQAQNARFDIPELTLAKQVKADGLVQPYLDDFIAQCKKYGIEYHDNLFELKEIAVVDTLTVSPKGGTLGMLVRNEDRKVEKIIFSWMTLLDKEILKVVAFHEFGHYFLGYKHTCNDCNTIMAAVNSSYFDIIKDWDYHVEKLFLESPVYLNNQNTTALKVD